MELLIDKQKKECMLKAISQLPPKYRFVIEVRFLDGLSYQQIADILQLPIGTVKTQIHRARRMLVQMLDGKL